MIVKLRYRVTIQLEFPNLTLLLHLEIIIPTTIQLNRRRDKRRRLQRHQILNQQNDAAAVNYKLSYFDFFVLFFRNNFIIDKFIVKVIVCQN